MRYARVSKFLIVFLAVVIAVIALGVWWLRPPPTATQPVRMGYLPMISSLTYFVALDEGFFVDEGIEVKGIPIQTSNDIATSLERGDIEVGVELAVIPLLNQIKPDLSTPSPFIIFSASTITEKNGFDSVLAGKDSPLSDLAGLSGKKIAVFPGTTADRTLRDVFTTLHPTLPPPVTITMSPSLHLGALERGEVDAVHAYEPYLSVGLIQKGFKKISGSLYAIQLSPNPIGVAAINRRWSEKNPELARKVVRAMDRASVFIDAYPDKSRLIAAKYTKAEPDVAKAMNIMPMSTSTKLDRASMKAYFNVLLKMKEISHMPDVDRFCLP